MSTKNHCFYVTIENSPEFSSCLDIICDNKLNPDQIVSVLIDESYIYFGVKSVDDNGRSITSYLEVSGRLCSNRRFYHPRRLVKQFNCEGLCRLISDPASKIVCVIIDEPAENIIFRSGTSTNGTFIQRLTAVNGSFLPDFSGVGLAKSMILKVFSNLVHELLQRGDRDDESKEVSILVSSDGRTPHVRVGTNIALDTSSDYHIKINCRFWDLFSKACGMAMGDMMVSVFPHDKAVLLDLYVASGKLSFLIDAVELVGS